MFYTYACTHIYIYTVYLKIYAYIFTCIFMCFIYAYLLHIHVAYLCIYSKAFIFLSFSSIPQSLGTCHMQNYLAGGRHTKIKYNFFPQITSSAWTWPFLWQQSKWHTCWWEVGSVQGWSGEQVTLFSWTDLPGFIREWHENGQFKDKWNMAFQKQD